jgi:hypothetical protein
MSFLPEGYKPTKASESEAGIMKGKAIVTLEKAERVVKTWDDGSESDYVNFQWRIKTNVDGNCHPNRVVFKKYYMTDGEFSTGAENRAKLANDLCTAGYDVDLSSEEAFYASVPGAVGIEANAILGEFKDKQTIRIVEKFAEKKGTVEAEPIPF